LPNIKAQLQEERMLVSRELSKVLVYMRKVIEVMKMQDDLQGMVKTNQRTRSEA